MLKGTSFNASLTTVAVYLFRDFFSVRFKIKSEMKPAELILFALCLSFINFTRIERWPWAWQQQFSLKWKSNALQIKAFPSLNACISFSFQNIFCQLHFQKVSNFKARNDLSLNKLPRIFLFSFFTRTCYILFSGECESICRRLMFK